MDLHTDGRNFGSRRYRYERQSKCDCNQSGTASDRLCQEAVFFCIQKGGESYVCIHAQ